MLTLRGQQDAKWGSGDPNQYLSDLYFAAYDDHRYLKYSDDNGINDAGTGKTPAAYLKESCHDDRSGNWPLIVSEFSLSVANDLEWNPSYDFIPDSHVAWYKQWFAAQIIAYEKQAGWVFWSWKCGAIGGRNDWRWSYQGNLSPGNFERGIGNTARQAKLTDLTAAVAAGAIPQNPEDAKNSNPCAGI